MRTRPPSIEDASKLYDQPLACGQQYGQNTDEEYSAGGVRRARVVSAAVGLAAVAAAERGGAVHATDGERRPTASGRLIH